MFFGVFQASFFGFLSRGLESVGCSLIFGLCPNLKSDNSSVLLHFHPHCPFPPEAVGGRGLLELSTGGLAWRNPQSTPLETGMAFPPHRLTLACCLRSAGLESSVAKVPQHGQGPEDALLNIMVAGCRGDLCPSR